MFIKIGGTLIDDIADATMSVQKELGRKEKIHVLLEQVTEDTRQ